MHTEHHASGHDLLRRQLNAATAGGQVNVDALSELVAATYHRFEQSIAGLDRQSRARMAVAIEERRRGETELRTQAHRFDVALENMSYGLCMYDASHRMVLCNRRYAELYKLPRPSPEVSKLMHRRSQLPQPNSVHSRLQPAKRSPGCA
jgi:PAS domain-containing protein